MSFARLWTWIALALPVLVALIVAMPAVDLAYQVRAGSEIIASGRLPTVDTWTFTVAGEPWTDQQWLAQVVLATVHSAGGWELLAVLRAVVVGAIVGCLLAIALARGTGPRVAAVLALVAFALMAPALALRPQLFGILCFALLVWLVAIRDAHPRWLWAAPLVAIAWVNVHGSFVLVPAILGYAWLDDLLRGRPWRASLAVLVVATVATLVNPFGVGAWAYAAGIGASPVIAGQVSEWQRTSPLTVTGAMFYASVLAVGAAMVAARRGLSLADWGLFAGLALMGAWAVRGVAWWPIGAVLLAATAYAVLPSAVARAATAPVARPTRTGPARLNAVVAALLGLALLAALPWWRPTDPLTGRAGLLSFAPSALASALRDAAGPGARVVVPQVWASWFEWAAPDALYFVDSRFELFPAAVWEDYARVAAGGESAADVLGRWSADLVVVAADERAPTGWAEVYRDDDGSILAPVVPGGS